MIGESVRASILISVALVVCTVSIGSGETFLVRPDGSGDFPTIQAAIDSASSGDEIELAGGTFTGDGNRDLDFSGKSVVLRSQDSDPLMCFIDCEGSASEPHRGVVFCSGEDGGAVLSGVSVLNGVAPEGPTVGSRSGGACLIADASPTIRNCVFSDNRADMGGGAVACIGASPQFSECVFSDNFSTQGGAEVWVEDGASSLDRCTFVRNTSRDGSGGGLLSLNSDVEFLGCVFLENYADLTGGAVYGLVSNFTLEGCTFSMNEALGSGGAVELVDSPSHFRQSTFYANGADNGGAIMCGSSNTEAPQIESCIVSSSTRGGSIGFFWCKPRIACSNFHGNIGGDWIGCIEDQLGVDGNISLDPEFCSTQPHEDRNWGLQADSPCAEENHPDGIGCGLMGAFDPSCGETAVRVIAWGRLKDAFYDN